MLGRFVCQFGYYLLHAPSLSCLAELIKLNIKRILHPGPAKGKTELGKEKEERREGIRRHKKG